VVEVEDDEDDEDEEEEEEEEECEELELDELELVLLLVGEELELVVVEVEEGGGGAGAHVSDSTTAPGGSWTEELGAPAAIGNVTVCPVGSLTVRVQVLAEATGDTSASEPASDVPASMIAMISLRLTNNSPQLLLATPCACLLP
jgi:hypothetical protein